MSDLFVFLSLFWWFECSRAGLGHLSAGFGLPVFHKDEKKIQKESRKVPGTHSPSCASNKTSR